MSFSFKLKSHPDKLLYDHLKNVGSNSKKIVERKKIQNSEVYSKLAYLTGISHDFAKATTYFQRYLEEGKKTEKAFHSKLSSVFGYYLCKKEMPRNPELGFIAWLVIMKHHTDISDLCGRDGELEKLKDLRVEKEQIEDIQMNCLEELNSIYRALLHDVDIKEFFEKFDNLCEEIYDRGEKTAMEGKMDNYFLILFFYSVLLDADKLDASGIIFEMLDEERKRWMQIPPDLVDNYKKARFNENPDDVVNRSREESYHDVVSQIDSIDLEKERIMSIELPTGCGKTLAAISFSLKLRERIKNEMKFVPRIIYSLPFLSIIDQNADVLSDVLVEYSGIARWSEIYLMDDPTKKKKFTEIPTSLLLKHHHLSDIIYKEKENEFDVEKSLLLTEGWHSEIVITTFVQLFHSLVTNRKRAARKFHNMTNSIIILDEVQSLPYEYWLLIKESIKHLAYEYNCWIIFMTATMPLIFSPEEVKSLVKDKEKYFQQFNRLKYLVEEEEKTLKSASKEILEADGDIAVIVNTIGASKELYELLKDELKSRYGEPKISKEGIAEFSDIVLINLSTNILPRDRKKKIEKIKDKNEKKRKMAITTQLVEAGVDIDMDNIFRDFAPLDSIIQSGGRCNRNGRKENNLLKVINLTNEKGRKFSNMIYDSVLLNTTSDIINTHFEEKDVNDLVHKYFKKVKSYGTDDPSKQNMEAMKKLNFTKLGNFRLFEDDLPKVDVFIESDDEDIEIDKRASELWKKYEEINMIKNRRERRREFLEIRNKFYEYVISVPEEKAERILNPDLDIGYVSKEDLKKYYDLETGFKGDSGAWTI